MYYVNVWTFAALTMRGSRISDHLTPGAPAHGVANATSLPQERVAAANNPIESNAGKEGEGPTTLKIR